MPPLQESFRHATLSFHSRISGAPYSIIDRVLDDSINRDAPQEEPQALPEQQNHEQNENESGNDYCDAVDTDPLWETNEPKTKKNILSWDGSGERSNTFMTEMTLRQQEAIYGR